MEDREFFIVFGIVLAIVQFLYRVWDKQDNKAVMDAAKKDTSRIIDTLDKGIGSFSEHVERGRDVHYMVRELAAGRQDALNAQRELIGITGTLVSTQQQQVRLLEKLEERIKN